MVENPIFSVFTLFIQIWTRVLLQCSLKDHQERFLYDFSYNLLCIQFLDERKQFRNNKLSLGLRLRFKMIWVCTEKINLFGDSYVLKRQIAIAYRMYTMISFFTEIKSTDC